MNKPYLKHLNKIEFVLTNACTGRCIHCSQGEHSTHGECIDVKIATDAVKQVVKRYDIKTVMVFGGEPLLFVDTTCAILACASELSVPKRQLITNGFFTRDRGRMREVALRLAECGVNDLLLSVDAFHQQTIPLEIVHAFAEEVQQAAIPIRLQPAWLVSREDDNPYNRKTKEALSAFRDTGIPTGEGNVIFPEGNAIRYLSEYFTQVCPENPYEENPYDVRCLSVAPDGSVLGGNLYERDILAIIDDYIP